MRSTKNAWLLRDQLCWLLNEMNFALVILYSLLYSSVNLKVCRTRGPSSSSLYFRDALGWLLNISIQFSPYKMAMRLLWGLKSPEILHHVYSYFPWLFAALDIIRTAKKGNCFLSWGLQTFELRPLSWKVCWSYLLEVPQNVTLFGNMVVEDVIS